MTNRFGVELNKVFQDKNWINISNVFTILRIVVSPLIMFELYCRNWELAFGLFVFGAITDFLDGYLARLLNMQTNLGRMLDPLADKIFLISLFYSLSFISSPSFRIPSWFVYLILFREIVILLGSGILLVLKVNFKIQPILWGKLTTFFQIIFIGWIFSCCFFHWIPQRTYNVSLILLALYSVFSLLQYIRVGLRCLRE